LNDFLASPRGYIPGTAMSFAGLQRPQQRADVIAYLNTLSDNPKPLPTETASKPPEGAKPTAEAGKPEAGKPAPGQPAQSEQPASTAAPPKQ
jgi:cytochrome c